MSSALIRAFEAGEVELQWTEVVSEHGNHRAVFRMLADGPKIGGIRQTVSPIEATMLCDRFGWLLPTPRLLDLYHDQADIQIRPSPKNYVPNFSEMVTEQAARDHSLRVDALIGDRVGSVSPFGKHWTAGDVVALYAWHVPSSECGWSTTLKAVVWHQIPTYPSSIARYRVIQPHAKRVHVPGYHDYAMVLQVVHGTTTVDGIDVPTKTVYADPGLAPLATGGAPLLAYRLESVPLPHQPESDKPWGDLSLPLGQRVIAWCRSEMAAGVRGTPTGSMLHPRIREYHRPVTRKLRNGIPHPQGTETPLRLDLGARGHNWCASSRCAGIWECATDDELAKIPHGYRCSGIEIWNDASAAGMAVERRRVLDGSYEPQPGDCPIYDRISWHTHVTTYIERTGPDTFRGIGGNEGDRWNETDGRRFDDRSLIGFVRLPKPEIRESTPAEVAEAGRLYELSRRLERGGDFWAEAMEAVGLQLPDLYFVEGEVDGDG